ncbi:MAG TPA: TadE/TadG family type IV pilus assembly protein [Pseudolysinimonas sp.]|nr:TadE/TadG family type IV pilus assembly protein [Pseudolysinimonas sp.]
MPVSREQGQGRTGWCDDRGSAVAEFTLVGALLTVLTLSVLQLALTLHIRNTTLDAAAEGARYAALADNSAADGVQRTRDLISLAIGADYADDVTASSGAWAGHPAVAVTVRTTLPLFGLVGVDGGLEVTGHAAVETLD